MVLLTAWPNQHAEPKGELVSSHVLLRCLHDVCGEWIGGGDGGGDCLCKCQCEFSEIKASAGSSITTKLDHVGTNIRYMLLLFMSLLFCWLIGNCA